jgi:hypothetical protein
MPAAAIVNLANEVGQQLGDWIVDHRRGGPLAGHGHAEVRAFAGAGKSFHLTRAVRRAVGRRLRVLVVANTNNQVRELAHRLAALGLNVVHIAADGEEILHPPPRLISG